MKIFNWFKRKSPKEKFENILSEDVANLIGLPSEDFNNLITGRNCNISFKTLCLIEDL